METITDQIKEEAQTFILKHTIVVLKHIVDAFKELKKIQPNITSISRIKGNWGFEGFANGVYTDNDWNKEKKGTSGTRKDFDVFLRHLLNPKKDVEQLITCNTNESCFDVLQLCDYFYKENGLTFFQFIQSINEEGVTFSESTEYKKKETLLKELIKEGLIVSI